MLKKLLIVLVALTGCLSPIPCETKSDCDKAAPNKGLICNAQICVVPADGGTSVGGGTNSGGGNASGGGMTATGGGTTNTGGGGASAGGGTTQTGGGSGTCGNTPCDAFFSCISNSCQQLAPAKLAFGSLAAAGKTPRMGTITLEYDTNSIAPAAWDVQISSPKVVIATSPITFGAPNGAGAGRLIRVGFFQYTAPPGAPSGPTTINATMLSLTATEMVEVLPQCPVKCVTVGDECVTAATGASACMPAGLRLAMSIQVPAALGNTPVIGGPANSQYRTVTGQVEILRDDAGLPTGVTLPTTLTPSISVGASALNRTDFDVNSGTTTANTFPFTIGLLPTVGTGVDTTVTVAANFMSADASVSLKVDTLGPSLNSSVVGRNAGTGLLTGSVFRRDEQATIRVSSTEVVSALTVTYGGKMASKFPTPCGTNCTDFVADLWVPTLNAMTGSFAVAVEGRDVLGNVSVVTAPSIPVTRLRWQTQTNDLNSIRAALVLDTNGTVFVGTTNTNTNGNIYAFQQNGTSASGWDAGGVNVGAVVSLAYAVTEVFTDGGTTTSPYEALFYNANTGNGAVLSALKASAPVAPTISSTSSQALCSRNSAGGMRPMMKSNAAIALMDEGNQKISAVSILANDNSANLGGSCRWAPFDTGRDIQEFNNMSGAGSSGIFEEPGNLVINRAFGSHYVNYVSNDGASLQTVYRGLTQNTQDVANSTNVGPVVSTSGGAASTGLVFVESANIGYRFTGLNETSVSGIARINNSGAIPPAYFTSAATTLPLAGRGSPVIVGDTLTAGFIGGRYYHRIIASDGVATELTRQDGGAIFPAAGAKVFASPVIGNSRVFAVSQSGEVVSHSSTNNFEWAIPLATPSFPSVNNVTASPTLARNKLNSTQGGAFTGILYVASGNGILTSLIVDDTHTNCSALWPKWQKDIFNSGNSSFTVADGGVCP
jgi:hypothetical protein